MMASMSGSFVPPTARSSGCSQKRVTATGVTPHARRVSVADGTRLTTRTTMGEPYRDECVLPAVGAADCFR